KLMNTELKQACGGGVYKRGFEGVMSKREAAQILGVWYPPKKDVKEAYRKQIMIYHPDKGESVSASVGEVSGVIVSRSGDAEQG
uniref:J domain-containing protein n=1 Tax=Gouania willdenowi TaxID=441366 RepID=A0A8C5E570_GOUWI